MVTPQLTGTQWGGNVWLRTLKTRHIYEGVTAQSRKYLGAMVPSFIRESLYR